MTTPSILDQTVARERLLLGLGLPADAELPRLISADAALKAILHTMRYHHHLATCLRKFPRPAPTGFSLDLPM